MTTRTLDAVAATLLSLCLASSAVAGPALSWNLSRDIMHGTPNNNPNGPWTYMMSATPHVESSYSVLNQFSAPCPFNGGTIPSTRCWQDAGGYKPVLLVADQPVTANGIALSEAVPIAYPSPTQAVIVRWTSPLNGIARIAGRLSDIDASCGDGVRWSLDQHNTTITQGTINNTAPGFGRTFSTKASVVVGTPLYLIVESGPQANGSCDPTEIDLLITMQL